MKLPAGVYRHFKGRYYLVLGEARHSETGEILIVYQPLYGEPQWFVRPKAMFVETVEYEGREISRFQFVGAEIPDSPHK